LLTETTTTGHHPTVNRPVLAFLQEELAYLSEIVQGKPITPAALLMKLRQATLAYSEGRTTDTITLLKNALNGDPHHQGLLACLSQVLYGLAAHGTPTALPEAREYAQRSMIASEKQRPVRLELYQYLAAVTERAFSEERTLEWLRNSNLLDTTSLQRAEGLLANQGISLRSWGLLATIQPALWEDHELQHIKNLVYRVVGGAALYLHWLRPLLLQRIAVSKVANEHATEIEEIIGASWQAYEAVNRYLANFPMPELSYPWLVKVRYINTLAQLVPAASFDTILCNIALDAQGWQDNTYPHREAQTLLEDNNLSYWRLWAQSLSSSKDQRKSHLFPTEEAYLDADLITEATPILEMLRELELRSVKTELWEDLKPWLTRWQPEHLLAIATGSNQPRNRFAPSLAPFNTLYRKWQEPSIQSHLMGDVVAEVAKRGGFASWAEALATLEGAFRLLDDPVHGIVANQRRSLKLAKKHNPAKFANKFLNLEAPSGTTMAFSLMPLGLLGAIFAAFTLSENLSQAVGISLALVGVCGVLFINMAHD
jgi:hypothetical protein